MLINRSEVHKELLGALCMIIVYSDVHCNEVIEQLSCNFLCAEGEEDIITEGKQMQAGFQQLCWKRVYSISLAILCCNKIIMQMYIRLLIVVVQ